MIIECPYCETRFRLEERSLGPKPPATLRCSQCRRTFALPPIGSPDDFDDVEDEEIEEEQSELRFAFDDGEADRGLDESADGSEEEAEDDDDAGEEEAALPPAGRRGAGGRSTADRSKRRTDQPSLFDDFEDEEYSIGESPRRRGSADKDDAEDDEEYYLEDEQEVDVSASVQVRPLLVFVVMVVAGYAALSWTLRSDPDWARNLVQQLPLFSSEINASRLGRAVVLEELHGGYERTKGGKLIFVVTGQARNEHDEPLRDIRVEFQLIDESGSPIAKQATTCGNPIRADLVRDLTEEQVAIVRGWGTKPPAETVVEPGSSCPIISIFLEVPTNVAEFSGEVVQAHRPS